jgi:hypothetical protein
MIGFEMRLHRRSVVLASTFKAGTQERTMTTQNATLAFRQNLEKLCCIIENAYGIGRLTVSDQSAMCDFPA